MGTSAPKASPQRRSRQRLANELLVFASSTGVRVCLHTAASRAAVTAPQQTSSWLGCPMLYYQITCLLAYRLSAPPSEQLGTPAAVRHCALGSWGPHLQLQQPKLGQLSSLPVPQAELAKLGLLKLKVGTPAVYQARLPPDMVSQYSLCHVDSRRPAACRG